MNYRDGQYNLKRKKVNEIKQGQAMIRNDNYQSLSLKEKLKCQKVGSKAHNKLMEQINEQQETNRKKKTW